jgi:hypothetical protein
VRQPLGYLFVLIGFLDWRLPTPGARRVFVVALSAFVLARLAAVEYAWHGLDATTRDMERSLALIPPGGKLLIAEADEGYSRWMHYLGCEVMIERSGLCSLAFSDPRQQVLVVKPAYRAIAGGYNDDPPRMHELVHPPLRSPETTPSGRIYWTHWRDTYDYLLLLATVAGATNPLPDRLSLAYEGSGFQLYRITR